VLSGFQVLQAHGIRSGVQAPRLDDENMTELGDFRVVGVRRAVYILRYPTSVPSSTDPRVQKNLLSHLNEGGRGA